MRVRKSHVCVGVWVCVCVCVCYPFPGRNHLCVSEKRVSEALGHWNPARSLPSLSHKIAQMQVKVRVKFPPSILLTYVQIRTELGTRPFLCFRVIDALTRHKRVQLDSFPMTHYLCKAYQILMILEIKKNVRLKPQVDLIQILIMITVTESKETFYYKINH